MFPTENLFFDVNAKLDEQKKGSNQVELAFSLLITTKPSIVKYLTSGVVNLEGPAADIKKKLEPNPKTKIPQILFAVYQDVFNSIYILASILNVPYPPPDLLHPMAEKIQILPSASPQKEAPAENQAPKEQPVAPAQPPPESQPAAQPQPTETSAPAATTTPTQQPTPAAEPAPTPTQEPASTDTTEESKPTT